MDGRWETWYRFLEGLESLLPVFWMFNWSLVCRHFDLVQSRWTTLYRKRRFSKTEIDGTHLLRSIRPSSPRRTVWSSFDSATIGTPRAWGWTRWASLYIPVVIRLVFHHFLSLWLFKLLTILFSAVAVQDREQGEELRGRVPRGHHGGKFFSLSGWSICRNRSDNLNSTISRCPTSTRCTSCTTRAQSCSSSGTSTSWWAHFPSFHGRRSSEECRTEKNARLDRSRDG